ncbi:MAG: hypothetical protein AAF950_08340 [Pseudomonadota bacterium]
MKINWAVAGAFTLAVSACATSDTTTTSAVSAEAATTSVAPAESETATVVAASDPNRRICKNTQIIGSNFKKRVCATQAEWDELQERTEHTAQYIRKNIRSQSALDAN